MSFAKQFFRLDEVAIMLSVHVVTVRRWTDGGKLPYILTPGGHRRIARHTLIKLGASANMA